MKERRTLITAHSGSDGTPDNSMEFVRYALTTSADALEIDVRRAEGGLVISHDAADGKAVELKEVFLAVKNHPIRINCDLKEHGLEEAVYILAEECGLPEEQILYSGSVTPCAVSCDCRWKNVEIYWNVEECVPDIYVCEDGKEKNRIGGETADRIAEEYRARGIQVVNINEKYINSIFLKKMEENDMEISAWTVNDPERVCELLNLGARNITTRRPAAVLKLREERQKSGK